MPKNTLLLLVLSFVSLSFFSCNAQNKNELNPIYLETGADQFHLYYPFIKDKKVGVVTNQSGIIIKKSYYSSHGTHGKSIQIDTLHLVDHFLHHKINLKNIYAPEHGFRGIADAGELIKDGKDSKTGLPIISLYGNNKKPTPKQLEGIDVMIFDLQDVGVRFYTYISSLHYVMEACAENNIPLIVLDRPNPNGSIIDGPVLEIEHKSFVGMHPIPILHGMTIGEYAQMINGEKWLNKGIQCQLTVIPCEKYNRKMEYHLPIKPSPNLPNSQSINLYASLCLFEGTNVSMGRGTNKQFQLYGSPFLKNKSFSFTPKPNEGAKDPLHNGKLCYGEDLTQMEKVNKLELKWLINAYQNTSEPTIYFNSFFVKLAGTKKLQEQIEKGVPEEEIRKSWGKGLEQFKLNRENYLLYE